MAKLDWSILNDSQKLWVRILTSRYLKRSNFLDCIPNPKSSTIWRDILKGREILKKGMIMGVGDGCHISLWYHHWVGECPIYLMPNFEIPNFIAHWRVVDIIRQGNWYLDDIIHLIPDSLADVILSIPLSTTHVLEDFLKWRSITNGNFSIKTAYGISSNITTPRSRVNCWKSLWKINAPLKYKMLLWNCFSEILPVGTVLGQKIEGFSPLCARCLDNNEDHLHLFRDCPSSFSFWCSVITKTNTVFNERHIFFLGSWQEWIGFNMKQSDLWRTTFAVGCWHIWIMRNKAVFDGKMLHPSFVFNRFYVDYCLTNVTFQTNLAKPLIQSQLALWRPAQPGAYKLNIDGSWKDVAKAGGGRLIRRDNGTWFMGFSSKYRSFFPLAAELQALRDVLLLAKCFQLTNIEVETDAKSILIMLDNAEKNSKHDLIVLISEVLQLLKLNWSITIAHIKRDANQVAHCLAHYAHLMDADHVTHQGVPDCARKAYDNDLMNVPQSSSAAATQ
ncbi:hypothetical protein RDABS01_029277 [Bienertia sinuspersici]